MASEEKLRKRIAEIISRPNNVDCEEIVWVLNQLGCPKPRQAKQGLLYRIPESGGRLLLNPHNNGKSHLPPYCVDEFRERMMEVGLYDYPD